MKRIIACLMLVLLAAPAGLLAQTSSSTDASQSAAPADQPTAPVSPFVKTSRNTPPAPFSRLGLQAGIGLMGINMQAAVEANRHLNIRGIGNYFSYTVNNIKVSGGNGSNGVNVTGNLKFATAGLAFDYYPWPNHGFRLSPGAMLYNQSGISASGLASPGNQHHAWPAKVLRGLCESIHPQCQARPELAVSRPSPPPWVGETSSPAGAAIVRFPSRLARPSWVPTPQRHRQRLHQSGRRAHTNGPSLRERDHQRQRAGGHRQPDRQIQERSDPLKVYPIVSFGAATTSASTVRGRYQAARPFGLWWGSCFSLTLGPAPIRPSFYRSKSPTIPGTDFSAASICD